MKRFSVGIVGAGVVTQNTHLPVLCSMPNVNVAWLTDADAIKARQIAEAYGVPHVELPQSPRELPECDVVLLAIPLPPRGFYYEQLAARGTAVFAEKPFAINNQDHQRFQQLFPSYKIGCGYMRRMYSTNRLFHQIVKEAWFGPLHRIHIREGGRTTKTGVDQSYQDLSIKDGGGILINLGCHLLDLAFFISGAQDFIVNANEVVFDGNTDRKAQGNITLLSSHGHADKRCQFDFCVSWLDNQANTVELEFEKLVLVGPISPGGTIEVWNANKDRLLARLESGEKEGAITSNQAFFLEWREFLQGLEDLRPSIVSAGASEVTANLIDRLLSENKLGAGK